MGKGLNTKDYCLSSRRIAEGHDWGRYRASVYDDWTLVHGDGDLLQGTLRSLLETRHPSEGLLWITITYHT